MFKGIKLGTFLSTPEEWHSLVIGFFEVLCPWPPRIKLLTPVNKYLQGEYHYYLTGRGAGFIALLCVILLFSWLIKEVLL
jgi:hypothetical protein